AAAPDAGPIRAVARGIELRRLDQILQTRRGHAQRDGVVLPEGLTGGDGHRFGSAFEEQTFARRRDAASVGTLRPRARGLPRRRRAQLVRGGDGRRPRRPVWRAREGPRGAGPRAVAGAGRIEGRVAAGRRRRTGWWVAGRADARNRRAAVARFGS